MQFIKLLKKNIVRMLTPDVAHEATFLSVTNFKDHIVWFVLPKIDAERELNHVGQRNVFVKYVNQ